MSATLAWAVLAYLCAGCLTARWMRSVSTKPDWRKPIWAVAVLGWPVWWCMVLYVALVPPAWRGRR